MVFFIEDLWIFSRDGTPLVEVLNNVKVDAALFGPFLSAIGSFSEHLSGKSLKSFSLGDYKFTILPCLDNQVVLVARCKTTIKEKTLVKTLKIIKEFFENMYASEEVLNWDGDLSTFIRFKDRIELYIKMAQL